MRYFYPRSPCGERRPRCYDHRQDVDFYPRSPCGERQPRSRKTDRLLPFLSTLSLRRATPRFVRYGVRIAISIHALLAESDTRGSVSMSKYLNFYPRSPCGERRINRVKRLLPSWISIHALLAESDCLPICKYGLPLIFLSTLSLRRATSGAKYR